jgi:peptide/nickel transport system substrate-binding protein
MQANDWGTLITRRTSKKGRSRKAWSIFHTRTSAPDFFRRRQYCAAAWRETWFGWPTDPKISPHRHWFKAPTCGAEEAVAYQVEAYTNAIPNGQFKRAPPTQSQGSYRPVVFLWNVEKK